MRDIKFRAWDRVDSHMLSWNFMMQSAFNDKDSNLLYSIFKESALHSENIHLMQYTGLHDKNGKEIYEGDIVSGKDYQITMLQHWGLELKDEFEAYIIKYDEASFKLFDRKDQWVAVLNHHVMSKAKDLNVIGNIYENPELLKEE